jgi:mannose-1-phosphate guanylyltransferase/mannose-6-phosphate isomerase
MMVIVPVIMCGGSGVRLWPASRPSRPKQFIPLIGELSSFQQTVLRVSGIDGAATPIVVAGVGHDAMLKEQLAGIGASVTLLLEPQPRDSAPAMAAAAVSALLRDPQALLVVVASDHYVPDPEAFRAAVLVAAEAAQQDQIVTLGITPTSPATAYGYILAGEADGAVKPVMAFAEKPSLDVANRYVADGYLWNSGNFIVRADRLLAELDAFAPGVRTAVEAAVKTASADGLLGEAFAEAPKISIDYAVMEKTRHAAVLPVDFAWSDLGAWDAIWAASPQDEQGNATVGDVRLFGSRNILARTDGAAVVGVGLENLAIVVERDAVLVCALDASQQVKVAVDFMKTQGASVIDTPPTEGLAEITHRLELWLYSQALPLWQAVGADHEHGGFRDALDAQARAPSTIRRARVQGRQVYVYARAGVRGWPGPWRETVQAGLGFFEAHFRRPDGQFRTLVDATGAMLDNDAMLYDQAFVLLAWSALGREEEALGLLDALEHRRTALGGFRESGSEPYLANPLMHLFEAVLAWVEVGGEPRWRVLADQLGSLALSHLIDPVGGFLREVFDADWRPAVGPLGAQVEPGHQFEWAFLLSRWSKLGGPPDAAGMARRLYEAGLKGIDPVRGVAVNAMTADLKISEPCARLWPQTEWLRAAVEFDRPQDALRAASTLSAYLDMPVKGLWRDRLNADGSWVDEPSPASSLYHITGAIDALTAYRR